MINTQPAPGASPVFVVEKEGAHGTLTRNREDQETGV